MRGIFLTFVLVTSLLAAGPAARQKPQDVAFQAAQRTETVGGDLKGAIKQYEQIVATYGKTDRPIAAKALLRMAECYQRLGRSDARRIYQRIVRDYPEQQAEATAARQRLGAGADQVLGNERAVWVGEMVPSQVAVSPDGLLLAYLDAVKANIGLRTIADGTDRMITTTGSWTKPEFPLGLAFSRDGKQLAYIWFIASGDNPKAQLRILPVTASGVSEPRIIAEYGGDDFIEVLDWSPDGTRLLVQAEHKRTNEIAFVGLNGSRQVIKTLGVRGTTRARVSPDGRHVAFDAPASERVAQHDVFVIGADGTGETAVATGPMHDVLAGWSPDGRRVLFMTDAGGETSHLVSRVVDGSLPQQKPEILRRNVRGTSIGVTAAGALFTYVWNDNQVIHIAPIDLATGKLVGKPAATVPGFWARSRQPKWSPDGKRFAALASSRTDGRGQRILSIHQNDQSRYLPLKLTGIWTYDWSPDGRSLLARGTDLDGRHGLFRIDVESGDAAPVLLNNPPAHPDTREFSSAPDRAAYFLPHWNADGTKFYYTRGGDASVGGMFERNVASGQDRILYELRKLKTVDGTPFGNMRDQIVSPDGKLAAGFSVQPESVLWVVSLADGTVREIHRVKRRNAFTANALVWTPDSKALVLNVRPETFGTPKYSGRGHELLVVPITGETPRKLDLGGEHLRDEGIAIHPGGREIAFVAGDRATGEIRVLENFLPSTPVKRGSQ